MKQLTKIWKNTKWRARKAGMSYVELIVVLSIFSLLSGVVIYNYGAFQGKVDVKSLASDIALRVVEAQKLSLAGLLPVASVASDWKPSYGVYFNISKIQESETGVNDKSFVYFVDLDQNRAYDAIGCSVECLEKIDITKGNIISGIEVYSEAGTKYPIDELAITFSRPSSSAVFFSGDVLTEVSYVQISIASPRSPTATINIYSSGRIQVN